VDRVLREPWISAISSLAEVHPGRTILGIAAIFMFHMRCRTVFYMAAVKFHSTMAIFTSELCITVENRIFDRLELPIALVATSCCYAAASDLALVDPFFFRFHWTEPSLADGVLGEAGLATVGSFAEEGAGGAILGVGLELVGDVGQRRVDDVAAMEPDGAGAVGAAELGVVVGESFDDRFELPERFVATAKFEAAALDLALIDLFGFGGHKAPLVVRL
jgi:hypothetical protein